VARPSREAYLRIKVRAGQTGRSEEEDGRWRAIAIGSGGNR
jgi:hypothetical protein